MNGVSLSTGAQRLHSNLSHQNSSNLREKSFGDLKEALLDGLNKKRDSINNQIKTCTDIDNSERMKRIRKLFSSPIYNLKPDDFRLSKISSEPYVLLSADDDYKSFMGDDIGENAVDFKELRIDQKLMCLFTDGAAKCKYNYWLGEKKEAVIIFSDGNRVDSLSELKKKTLILLSDNEYEELKLRHELEIINYEIEKVLSLEEGDKKEDKVSLFKVLSGNGKRIKKFKILYDLLETEDELKKVIKNKYNEYLGSTSGSQKVLTITPTDSSEDIGGGASSEGDARLSLGFSIVSQSDEASNVSFPEIPFIEDSMCFSIVNALLASQSDLSNFYACLSLAPKVIKEIEENRAHFKQSLRSEESDLLSFKKELNDGSSKGDQQQNLEKIRSFQQLLSQHLRCELASNDDLKTKIKKVLLDDLYADKYFDFFFNKKEVQDYLTKIGEDNFNGRLYYFLKNIDQFKDFNPTKPEKLLIYSRICEEFNGELLDLPAETQITAVCNYFGGLNVNEFFNYSTDKHSVVIAEVEPSDASNSAESSLQVEQGESSKSSSKSKGKRGYDDSDCGGIKRARCTYKLINPLRANLAASDYPKNILGLNDSNYKLDFFVQSFEDIVSTLVKTIDSPNFKYTDLFYIIFPNVRGDVPKKLDTKQQSFVEGLLTVSYSYNQMNFPFYLKIIMNSAKPGMRNLINVFLEKVHKDPSLYESLFEIRQGVFDSGVNDQLHHGFALAFFYFKEEQDFETLLQIIATKEQGKEKLKFFIQKSEEYNIIDIENSFLTKDQIKNRLNIVRNFCGIRIVRDVKQITNQRISASANVFKFTNEDGSIDYTKLVNFIKSNSVSLEDFPLNSESSNYPTEWILFAQLKNENKFSIFMNKLKAYYGNSATSFFRIMFESKPNAEYVHQIKISKKYHQLKGDTGLFHLVLFSKDGVFNSIMLFLHELITKKQPNNRDSVIELIKKVKDQIKTAFTLKCDVDTYAPRIDKLTELEKCICSASVVSPQPPSSKGTGPTPSPLLLPSGPSKDSSDRARKRKDGQHTPSSSPKKSKLLGIDLLLEASLVLNSSEDAQSNELALSNQGSSSNQDQGKETNGFSLGDNSARDPLLGQDIGGASQMQDANNDGKKQKDVLQRYNGGYPGSSQQADYAVGSVTHLAEDLLLTQAASNTLQTIDSSTSTSALKVPIDDLLSSDDEGI